MDFRFRGIVVTLVAMIFGPRNLALTIYELDELFSSRFGSVVSNFKAKEDI